MLNSLPEFKLRKWCGGGKRCRRQLVTGLPEHAGGQQAEDNRRVVGAAEGHVAGVASAEARPHEGPGQVGSHRPGGRVILARVDKAGAFRFK